MKIKMNKGQTKMIKKISTKPAPKYKKYKGSRQNKIA